MVYGLADIVTIGRDGVRVVAGWTEPVTIPTPAAGANLAGRTIPGETYERLLTATATLTADATALTRNPTLDLVDGAGKLQYQVPLSLGVVASTTLVAYAGINGAEVRTAAGVSVVRFPDLLLPPGYTLRFNGNGLDAGDTWTNVSMILQRYPSNLVAILQEG